MSSIQIGKAIYQVLSGDTVLHTYLSGGTSDKIYPIFAPDETLNPFIVYGRRSVNANYTKDGLTYDTVGLYVNVVSDNYSECIAISDAVRSALERKVYTYSGVSILQCILSNVTEDYGVDGYITTLEFIINAK